MRTKPGVFWVSKILSSAVFLSVNPCVTSTAVMSVTTHMDGNKSPCTSSPAAMSAVEPRKVPESSVVPSQTDPPLLLVRRCRKGAEWQLITAAALPGFPPSPRLWKLNRK